MGTLRKERMELDEDRRAFEARLATVKDVLPLAEQLLEIMADGYNNILSIFFYIISSLITMTGEDSGFSDIYLSLLIC